MRNRTPASSKGEGNVFILKDAQEPKGPVMTWRWGRDLETPVIKVLIQGDGPALRATMTGC